MKFSVALFSLLLLYNFNITAQSPFEYAVHIDSIQIPGLPGLHSYAFAEHDGKWLIIGGRTDGLHPRQPFASFPVTIYDVVPEGVAIGFEMFGLFSPSAGDQV